MNSIEYPFSPCLHPRKIYNKHTKHLQVVGCGKCVACMNRKSSRNQRLCELEELGAFSYSYFVTLTYRSSEIPKYQLVEAETKHHYYLVDKNPRSENFGELVQDTAIYLSPREYSYLQKKFSKRKYTDTLQPDEMSYLSYRDIQLFNKILRKRIKEKYNEEIRFFVVGEYGPETLRAHWHIIYFTRKELRTPFTKRYIYQIWKKGDVDADRCKGGAISYAAAYVNSALSLPGIYTAVKKQPFTRHSIKMGAHVMQEYGLSLVRDANSKKTSRRGATSVYYESGDKVKRLPLDRTFKAALFPKPFGYESLKSDKSLSCYLRAYSHYTELFRDCYTTSVKELTKHVYDYLRTDNVTPYDMAFASFLEVRNYEKLAPMEETFNRIYRFLLFSRKYIREMELNPRWWNDLVLFYDLQEYNQLCVQYESQEKYFEEFGYTDKELDLFYSTTFSVQALKQTILYSQFSNNHQEIHNRKITRKRFNDLCYLLES